MKANASVGLCVAFLAAAASAQTARPAGSFQGVLTGTNVYVRSGPGGPGAYPCAKLSKPDQVTVVDKLDDWYKIPPPPGCHSAIRKTYVEVDSATKTGTVTGDNVWVRAAGVLRGSNFYTLQFRLSKGDRVRVIGDAGDYYKIASPPGAYFWISARYVRPATAADARVTLPTRPTPPIPTTVPVSPPPIRPPTPSPTTRRAVTTVTPALNAGELEAAIEKIKVLEKLLVAEFAKPVAERDLEPLLPKYQGIKAPDDSEYIERFIKARTDFIRIAIERKQDMATVEKLVKDVREREEALKLARQKLDAGTPTTRPVTAYSAQGILMPSDVFPGGPAGPKRYLVRDRHTLFINAYVQCTSGAVNLDVYVGNYVGITGRPKYDARLGLDIVEAGAVKVLAENVDFPQPPKPIVKPIPKPEPIIKPAPLVTPAPKPVPVIEPKPVVTPAPKPVPVVEPKPVVTPAPKPEPIIRPAPLIKPKPITVITPKVEPTTQPVAKPAPKPAPVIKVSPTTMPVVRFGPATRPAPKTQPATAPTTKPAAETEWD